MTKFQCKICNLRLNLIYHSFLFQYIRLAILSVIRCPSVKPIKNGYTICHPGHDPRYGASCVFGCYDGHDLEGASYIECLKSGIWSSSQPYCKSKINFKYRCLWIHVLCSAFVCLPIGLSCTYN